MIEKLLPINEAFCKKCVDPPPFCCFSAGRLCLPLHTMLAVRHAGLDRDGKTAQAILAYSSSSHSTILWLPQFTVCTKYGPMGNQIVKKNKKLFGGGPAVAQTAWALDCYAGEPCSIPTQPISQSFPVSQLPTRFRSLSRCPIWQIIKDQKDVKKLWA